MIQLKLIIVETCHNSRT